MAECARVANQVDRALKAHDVHVDFDHQGSVTNDTHIRLHSDVDLLVLPRHFVFVRAPLVPDRPYAGDPLAELMEIRRICHECLDAAYPAAEVDGDGSKAISISGGSLQRKVDVVPASWLNTQQYVTSSNKASRGIRVLDASVPRLIDNFPFLHNAWVTARDQETGGRLRQLIRLVKSIRSDSDKEPDVSSYHIAGLCFHLPPHLFVDDPRASLSAFVTWVIGLLRDASQRASVMVPNGTEKLFDRIKQSELIELLGEATELLRLAA
jgi:hypothetical protein